MWNKIKDWLYVALIQKDRLQIQEEAQKRGYEYGFHDAKEQYDAQKYRYNLLSDQWFVSVTDFLEVDRNGKLYLGGEEMTEPEIKAIKEEIKYLDKTRVWHIFQETLRQKAIDKAMLNSTEWEHVLAGKMMIHSLGIFKSIVEAIKRHK